MIFVKYSTIDQIPHVLLVAFREEQHSLCVALRCTSEAFSFWILANAFQYSLYSPFELLQTLFGFLGGGFPSLSRPETYCSLQLQPSSNSYPKTHLASLDRRSQSEGSRCMDLLDDSQRKM